MSINVNWSLLGSLSNLKGHRQKTVLLLYLGEHEKKCRSSVYCNTLFHLVTKLFAKICKIYIADGAHVVTSLVGKYVH